MRDAATQQGVLYAFIVLDNPANSIMDMQVGLSFPLSHAALGVTNGILDFALNAAANVCRRRSRADGQFRARQAGVHQIHGLLPFPILHGAP